MGEVSSPVHVWYHSTHTHMPQARTWSLCSPCHKVAEKYNFSLNNCMPSYNSIAMEKEGGWIGAVS